MTNYLTALVVSLSLWAGGAQASVTVFGASMSGAAESPPNGSPATGNVRVTYDSILQSLRIQADFSGLTGLTSAAHIHCCTSPGTNVGVATMVPAPPGFPLGVVAGLADSLLDLNDPASFNASFLTNNGGLVAARNVLIAGLGAGQAYFNIHTLPPGVPAGEIRGNLVALPPPATVALLALGLGMLAVRRRSGWAPDPDRVRLAGA
jgi:hypothetical protein